MFTQAKLNGYDYLIEDLQRLHIRLAKMRPPPDTPDEPLLAMMDALSTLCMAQSALMMAYRENIPTIQL